MRPLVKRLALWLTGAAIATAAVVFGMLGSSEILLAHAWHWYMSPCPTVAQLPAADCVSRQTATVTEIWSETRGDDTGTYEVYFATVRLRSGDTRRIDVNEAVLDTASTGDQAQVRMWRGYVIGMDIDGIELSEDIPLPLSWFGWAILAWDGVGVMLWATVLRAPFAHGMAEPLGCLVIWTLSGFFASGAALSWLTAHRWWEFLLAAVLSAGAFVVGFMGPPPLRSAERPARAVRPV